MRHGTPGGYTNHRCRCELCKRAHAQAANRYRVGSADDGWRRGSRAHEADTAHVLCWCQSEMRRLPWADIRAGRTFSCGEGCTA